MIVAFPHVNSKFMSSEPTSPRGPRGPYAKSALRRRSIVEAAHRVFATRGYRGGSFQDVADEVGMSQTSLLYYFPSKSELLIAVLNYRDTHTDDMGLASGAVSGAEASLDERVIRQAKINERLAGVLQLYTVLCGESVSAEHPAHTYFVERFAHLRQAYALEFVGLAKAGRLRPGVDPARAATNLIALWDGIQTQWLMAPESIDMPGCLRDYLELVLLPA